MPGQDEDDERVEGDLAEKERPVIGEDLVQERPAALRHAETLVDPFDAGPDRLARLDLGHAATALAARRAPAVSCEGRRRHVVLRSQNPGPIGSW